MVNHFQENKKLNLINGHFNNNIQKGIFQSTRWDQHALGSSGLWPNALKNSLQLVFASCQPMLVLWSGELFQFCNDAYSEASPLADGGAMGQPLTEGEGAPRIAMEKRIREVFATGKSVQDDGLWAQSYTPIFLDDGQIGGVLLIATARAKKTSLDRSDQARADQLRLVADFSPALIAYVDRDERYQFMNSQYEKWFKFVPERTVGLKILDVVGPEAYGKAQGPIKKALSGEHVHFENRIVLADGTAKHIDLQFVPFREQSGEVNGFIILGYDITERKHIEVALRESESRYRDTHEQLSLALESAQMSTWHIDLKSNRLRTFKDHRNFLAGQSQEFDVDETIDKWIHPDDAADSRRALRMTIETGSIYNDEYRIVQEDGSIRWMLSRGSAKFDGDGKVISISGVLSDITERRKKEDQYRAITELTPQFVWLGDASGSITFSNSTLLNYIGVAQAKTLGQSWTERLHPDDRQKVSELWTISLKSGEPYEVEFRILSKEGVYGWFLNRAIALRDKPSGKITGWLGVSTDITEIKAAQNEQRRIADILDSVMRFSSDLIFVKDRQSKMIYCNPETLKLIGLSECEVIGKTDIEFLGPQKGGEEIMSLDERIMKTGIGEVAEEWVQWPDGSKRVYMSQKQPRRDDQKNIVGLVGISRDITELKRVHQNLQDAKSEAEKASTSKSAFLANMSHEIRTPLGAIMGFVELIKDENITRSKFDQYISIIERNSSLLFRLIDDILDLSKVEAGLIQVEKVDFSLLELLHDFSSLMSLRAGEKGIIFKIITETSIPSIVNSDPTRIRQILMNVVGNAIKFTAQGNITMKVFYQEEHLHFEVRDTGKGISREQMLNLFQPFTQADASITRKFGGTGLGLVLSRRLAEALGGQFFLKESELGCGSTFVAKVKVGVSGKAQMVKSVDYRADLRNVPMEQGPLSHFKILLVEDSLDNQALISIFLEKSGAFVEIANDGAQGVEAAMKGNFDVVLMDLQMPIMDGVSAVKVLREKGYRKPIVALTANAMKEERQRCLGAGFSNFLTKPVQRNTLIAMLAQYSSRE